MAERVDIRDEITSGDAGFTLTWFADRRTFEFAETPGRERRRRSILRKEARAGMAAEESE